MIALGIDPGTRRIGYGVVDAQNGTVKFVSAGLLKITATEDVAALHRSPYRRIPTGSGCY
jgi:Holliday junction resolvasome RuvABC endonuclease subunit